MKAFFFGVLVFMTLVSCGGDSGDSGQERLDQPRDIAARAYLCFYASHLTLQAYQRSGVISGYSLLGPEPRLNRSHPQVVSGSFSDTMRYWAYQTNSFNASRIYTADPNFTEDAYEYALSPLTDSSNENEAISSIYLDCKNEWLSQN